MSPNVNFVLPWHCREMEAVSGGSMIEGSSGDGGGGLGSGDRVFHPTTAAVVAQLQSAMTVAVHRSHNDYVPEETAQPEFSWLQEDRERAPCIPPVEEKPQAMWGIQRKIPVDVLMMCWGMGSWLGVNGLYMQLPLLVKQAPEGWALPSSMVLAVQLANVLPVLYVLLRRLQDSEVPYIHALLATGAIALLLNAFFYDRTLTIASTEISFLFLALTCAAALVGCGSSVLFYPYLRHFHHQYLVTYLVGEGLSGFVPSLIALAQGIGGEPTCLPDSDGKLQPIYPPPRFGITVFLSILAVLGFVSLISFSLLVTLKSFDSERLTPNTAAKDEEASAERVRLTAPDWVLMLVGMAVLNAVMNGVMPSVQSFSCMPYGTQAYHLAVTLGAMANPAACYVGVWLRPLAPRALAALVAGATVPLGYIVATAALSPSPPLAGSAGGTALVVLSWVAAAAGLSYARMWVYGRAQTGGARGMRACGGATQAGSALGSLLMYVLVKHAALFVEKPPCQSAATGTAAATALTALLAPL